jgi:hypothetical protein
MAALVIAGCNGAEVLQPINRPLDDIATFVRLGVEPWRRATPSPFTQSALLRVKAFGANTPYATALNLLSIMTCAVGAVDAQARWAFAWAAPTRTRHTDGIEYLPKVRRIAALPGSDDNGQGQTVSINAQVDLAGDATARSTQPLVGYGPLFSAAGSFFRAPAALRWALT